MKLSSLESIFPSSYLPQPTCTPRLLFLEMAEGSPRWCLVQCLAETTFRSDCLSTHMPAIIPSAWCLESFPHHPLARLGFPSFHCTNTLGSSIELICLSVSSICAGISFRAGSRPCSSLNSSDWHSARCTAWLINAFEWNWTKGTAWWPIFAVFVGEIAAYRMIHEDLLGVGRKVLNKTSMCEYRCLLLTGESPVDLFFSLYARLFLLFPFS